MEISQHIKNLLKSNDRIILGGFGAFTTKQISAKFDAETKTMRPPLKIVTFDPSVQEDSGVLAKFMSEQEGISPENCKEQINEFVKTVKTKLETGKPVEFKDLGSFQKTPDGELKFSFLSEDNLLLDSFGLPAVSLSEKSIQKNISVKTEIKKDIPKTSKPVKPVVKKLDKKQERLKQKEERRKERMLAQKQKRLKQKTKKTDDKEKKKRKVWPILLILLAAIGIMLAALYFFKPNLWNKGYAYSSSKISQLFGGKDSGKYDIIEPGINDEIVDNKGNVDGKEDGINNDNSEDVYTDEDDISSDEDIEEGTDENFDESDEPADNESIAEDESVNETSQDAVEETVIEDISSGSSSAQAGKYYIIIASVQTEASAKKEVQRFASKGINAEYIYVPSKDRYRISAGEFSSAKAAQEFYSEMQAKHGNVEAWVWEKR